MTQRSPAERLRALAGELTEDLAVEVHRLYEVERHRDQLLEEATDLRRQLNRAQALAGERSTENASLKARIAELCPEEIIKARRDAFMRGAGFFRVISLGRNRYRTERLEPDRVRVTVRAD